MTVFREFLQRTLQLLKIERRRRRRKRLSLRWITENRQPAEMATQTLEQRLLLAVQQLAVNAVDQNDTGSQPEFSWVSTEPAQQTTVELWVDQFVGDAGRNSRVLYVPPTPATEFAEAIPQQFRLLGSHRLPFGHYVGWLREHTPAGPSFWHRVDFQLDNDADPSNSLPAVSPPAATTISVIREGQGYAGHELSESGIAWASDELLHDVWLNRQQADGSWAVHRRIRNVPGRSISFAELQAAPERDGYSFYGQITEPDRPLDPGDYRIYVRSVNAFVNSTGDWAGRGLWSRGVDFSYVAIEGANARPATLTATHELNPHIRWSAVEGAEHYLVSLWKGPDYQSERPLIFRSHERQIQFRGGAFGSAGRTVQLSPGDELHIKVRAIGQDGSHELFNFQNSRSTTIFVPGLATRRPDRPVLHANEQRIRTPQPLLEWSTVSNTQAYDVWISSVDLGHRIALIEVPSESVLLTPDYLTTLVEQNRLLPGFHGSDGLNPGTYRYWVRARSSVFTEPSAWSRPIDFEVSAEAVEIIEVNDSETAAETPLVAPNLVVSVKNGDHQFLVVSNGLGESFGPSVLARFEVNSELQLVRPVVSNGRDTQLAFPDLAVGSNVSGMKQRADGTLVVLSRGSSELRIVDPIGWQVLSTYSLVSDPNDYPDAIGLDLLPNGQVAVVFNRSDRLRIFDVTEHNQFQEIEYSGAEGEPGFFLGAGRGVQLSSIDDGEGAYRVFVATPSQSGVAVYEYNSQLRTLTPVTREGQQVLVQRSRLANPFHGGTIASIRASNGSDEELYFSADRSGFLTWVDPQSLAHGFIDLAEWMPSVDRDPKSDLYANPDDNSFDSTRIVSLGQSRLAVFSSRQESVVLELFLDETGSVNVRQSVELFQGYGGTFINHFGQQVVVGTASAPLGPHRQFHSMSLTTLVAEDGSAGLAMTVGTSVTTVLANPIVHGEVLQTGIVVQRADGGIRTLSSERNQEASENAWQTILRDSLGRMFRPTTDLFATYESAEGNEPFLFVSALPRDATEEDKLSLLALRQDESGQWSVRQVIEISTLLTPHRLVVSATKLAILDRYGGDLLVIREWQDRLQGSRSVYRFGEQQPYEFGRIRPAAAVWLDDETLVVGHDTVPDRGISVITDNDQQPLGTTANVFHANTTGTFAFDLHRYDHRRVITTTYGGDVVIKNSRTGTWELDAALNELDGIGSINAVESSSYHDGLLVVHSPASRKVAAIRVTETSAGFRLTTIGVHDDADAIAVRAVAEGYWVIRRNSVVFVPHF